ncbi:glutamate 5-kinase [Mycoplasmatota bacterium zrk1]
MASNRIVIKVGTSSLAYSNGKLNLRQIEKLCQVITDLSNRGKEIVLVTSGAIGAGIGRLGLNDKPNKLEMKQATAAIGQAYLMQIYQRFFAKYSQVCAQMLLTKEIVDNHLKRENVVRTFEELFKIGVIPIVNENDSVSTDEIIGDVFSDNDNLSSVVAVINKADLLIILSNIDGVYKKVNGNLSNNVINNVDIITEEIYGYVSNEKSSLGTGGMSSKLNAVKYAMDNSVDSIICNSKDLNIIYDCLEGKIVGTFFKAGKEDEN